MVLSLVTKPLDCTVVNNVDGCVSISALMFSASKVHRNPPINEDISSFRIQENPLLLPGATLHSIRGTETQPIRSRDRYPESRSSTWSFILASSDSLRIEMISTFSPFPGDAQCVANPPNQDIPQACVTETFRSLFDIWDILFVLIPCVSLYWVLS